MLLVVALLLVAWFALNVALLGAAALADRHGRHVARRTDATPAQAPVVALFR